NTVQLEYQSTEGISPAINSGELDPPSLKPGSIQLLYLDGDGGLTGVKTANAFKVTFKVIGGKAGDPVVVDAQIKTCGNADAQAMTSSVVKATMKIGAPLSGNAMLSGLTIGNASLSPAFDKNTMAYTASVPFIVGQLDIKATAEDPKSKTAISGNTLAPGAVTTVAITVTAENGTKKVYTIKVTREADPDYKASADASLSDIDAEGFLLSPPFSPETTTYIIWLPYETTEVKIEGIAADAKASVEITGADDLAEGQDNLVNVICTAEDGTTKEYTIIAKRAAANATASGSGSSDPVSGVSDGASAGSSASMIPADSSPSSDEPVKSGVQTGTAIFLALACLATGLTGGFLIGRRKTR
ncbi:MAG: cadherin-like beta sandwich domain-containing protein, partial [Saccharofermentanales bacterium]